MTTTPARVRCHSTEDLLGLVPYLLGYIPEDRLAFNVVADGQVGLSGSMELAAFDDPEQARACLWQAACAYEEASVLLSVWTQDHDRGVEMLERAVQWLGEPTVLDACIITDQTWQSIAPWGGESGPREALTHGRSAAEAVTAGLTVSPSRDELVKVVQGPTFPQFGVFRDCSIDDIPVTCTETMMMVDDLLEVLASGQALTAAQVAPLVQAIGWDVELRDAVWMNISGETAEEDVRLWTQVVSLTPDPWALTPVLLLGWASWIGGSGALLVACIERALELDPSSTMARLLSDVHERALPPRLWDEMRASWLDEVACRG